MIAFLRAIFRRRQRPTPAELWAIHHNPLF